MTAHDPSLPGETGCSEVDAFLAALEQVPVRTAPGGRGRLMFAIDATASRQSTWDQASHLQARMFEEAARLGGLEVQLAYFRGYGEFHLSPWVSEPRVLLETMTEVTCRSGLTQIERVLRHTLETHRHLRLSALVYVGDCVEEAPEVLFERAGLLGVEGVPAFFFHEGQDPLAGEIFRQLARLSGGAYAPFDHRSPSQLGELLSAVAAYAAGGLAALEDCAARTEPARRLLAQLRR